MVDYRKFLRDFVHKNRFRTIAEVGVWKAETSELIWDLPSVQKVYLIDPLTYENLRTGDWTMTMGGADRMSQQDLDELHASILDRMPNHAEFLRKPSQEAAGEIPDESLDLVFVDALHTYEAVREDIALWWPKVGRPGVLSGDDLSSRFPGVEKAVRERFGESWERRGRLWWVWKQ